jgi:hypothetical protein
LIKVSKRGSFSCRSMQVHNQLMVWWLGEGINKPSGGKFRDELCPNLRVYE